MTDGAGLPVPDARVFISDGAHPHSDIAMLSNDEGRYMLDDLLPGDYTVTVQTDDLGQASQNIRVEAGCTSKLNFLLP